IPGHSTCACGWLTTACIRGGQHIRLTVYEDLVAVAAAGAALCPLPRRLPGRRRRSAGRLAGHHRRARHARGDGRAAGSGGSHRDGHASGGAAGRGLRSAPPRAREPVTPTTVAEAEPITALTARFFQVMADPTRVRMLELLLDGERNVGDLVAALGL